MVNFTYVNSNDQVVPAFSGFGVQDRMKEKTAVEYMKTKRIYLQLMHQ